MDEFSEQDKEYAFAAYRDLIVRVNGDECEVGLLEILLNCSRKGVMKSVGGEWKRVEFEICVKRALTRQKTKEKEKQGGREEEKEEKEASRKSGSKDGEGEYERDTEESCSESAVHEDK